MLAALCDLILLIFGTARFVDACEVADQMLTLARARMNMSVELHAVLLQVVHLRCLAMYKEAAERMTAARYLFDATERCKSTTLFAGLVSPKSRFGGHTASSRDRRRHCWCALEITMLVPAGGCFFGADVSCADGCLDALTLLEDESMIGLACSAARRVLGELEAGSFADLYDAGFAFETCSGQ